jgi:hypothetical protein
MAVEKYIVAVKQWSLGFLKETVYRGNTLTVDREKNTLKIDGRSFQDVRDIDIAVRQAERFPDNPLIVPFTEETLARLRGMKAAQPSAAPKPRPGENMKVIQSDDDLHESIDISDTQVSRIKREAKEAERNKAKVDKLPIIKGDETPEERVGRLQEEKRAEGKMPIVRDDSLGVDGGSRAAALNAGQKLPTRDEIEAREGIVRAEAAARKKAAEAKRVVVSGDAEGDAEVQALVDASETHPQAPVEVRSAPAPKPAEDARFAALENKVNSLSDSVGALVAALTQKAAPAEPAPVVRVPVRAGRKAKG